MIQPLSLRIFTAIVQQAQEFFHRLASPAMLYVTLGHI